MFDLLREALSRKVPKYAFLAALVLGVLYTVLHAHSLLEAGATSAQVLANIVGDPGKFLFHLLLWPPYVGLLAWMVMESQVAAQRGPRTVLLVLVAVLVSGAAAVVVRDHTTAVGSPSSWKPPGVPPESEARICYISDIADLGVREQLVRFDAWAREELLTDSNPRAFALAPAADGSSPPLDSPLTLPQAFNAIFAETMTLKGFVVPKATLGAAGSNATPSECSASGSLYPGVGRGWIACLSVKQSESRGVAKSICGFLGPALSVLAVAGACLYFAWTLIMQWMGHCIRERPRQKLALAFVHLCLAAWVVLGAASQVRTNYYQKTPYHMQAVAALGLILFCIPARRVHGALDLVPQWVLAVVGMGAVGTVFADLVVRDAEGTAWVMRQLATLPVEAQVLLFAMGVLVLVAGLGRRSVGVGAGAK